MRNWTVAEETRNKWLKYNLKHPWGSYIPKNYSETNLVEFGR